MSHTCGDGIAHELALFFSEVVGLLIQLLHARRCIVKINWLASNGIQEMIHSGILGILQTSVVPSQQFTLPLDVSL